MADWEVKLVQRSHRNGGFYLHGVNHCAGGEVFHWHIRREYIDNSRYDFTNAEWEDNMRDEYDRVVFPPNRDHQE